MITFEKNYWSLYLDFLTDFEELKYGGISIPYLCVYYNLVNSTKGRFNSLLFDEKLTRQLKNQVKDKKEIQEIFNNFMRTHTKKSLVKNNQGKVVLHADSLLRFPRKTLIDYFDQSRTVILSEVKSSPGNKRAVSRKKKKVGIKTNTHIINRKSFKKKGVAAGINKIPIDYLTNYSINTKKAVTQVQNKARAILESYHKHPLYGDKQFQRTLLMQITQIINRIEETKNFLNTVSVSCIVISHPHFTNRILALAAAKKGVPTICMQHGIISSEFGYLPKIATIDAVYGNFEKDWYIKKGAPEESLEIIGHPRFDQVFTRPKITRSKFYNQLGLNKTKKTLMIVVRGNQNIDGWRIFLKSISERLDLNILIKDRPSKTLHDLSKEFPFIHSLQKRNLYDIIPNVDCVVAYSSTVGLEAMLHDKPVFILTERFPGYSGYYNGLDEMIQNDPKRLAEVVIEFFNNVNWRGYAERERNKFLSYAYPDFSSSGERVKKLINNLIS